MTNPASLVLFALDAIAVFNAMIGSSVAILTVSSKLPWTVRLPEIVVFPVTASVVPSKVRFAHQLSQMYHYL